ncbi:MAG: hypothetical protein IKM43_03025 [Clostridia bacterium]|nr:hypothetical protein [Clostridia bacterium]
MRYFKAMVQMGHIGARNSRETFLYIYAKNMMDAMKYAQNTPAIKHGKLPLKILEITEDEYYQGKEEDPYIKAIDQLNNGVR